MNRRAWNLLGFAACTAMMGYALYSQHFLGLEPCPLCIFQRVAVTGLGLIFLVAALHNPGRRGSALYAVLGAVAASAGAGVAGRHVWLQNLPADKVPSCGPGLDFMLEAFPLLEVVEMVLGGSGECASISWQFLGLSMPAWVLIASAALGCYVLWVNLAPSVPGPASVR